MWIKEIIYNALYGDDQPALWDIDMDPIIKEREFATFLMLIQEIPYNVLWRWLAQILSETKILMRINQESCPNLIYMDANSC